MTEARVSLDSELLRAFVTVADTNNVTKAADRLGRTQSAVSMQLKRLEEIVGEPLFSRGSRGVRLTRKGEDLLVNARRVMTALEETVASLKVAPLDGPVRIGIPEEYGKTIVARALRRFSVLHPKVKITVRFASSATQLAALEAGELDLAVIFDWREHAEGETLMSDPTVWADSTQLPRRDERPLPVAIYRVLGRPGPANFGQAMALSVVLMALTVGVVLVIGRLRPIGSAEF